MRRKADLELLDLLLGIPVVRQNFFHLLLSTRNVDRLDYDIITALLDVNVFAPYCDSFRIGDNGYIVGGEGDIGKSTLVSSLSRIAEASPIKNDLGLLWRRNGKVLVPSTSGLNGGENFSLRCFGSMRQVVHGDCIPLKAIYHLRYGEGIERDDTEIIWEDMVGGSYYPDDLDRGKVQRIIEGVPIYSIGVGPEGERINPEDLARKVLEYK